jgi:hypothetical protein
MPDDLADRYKFQEKHGRVQLWPARVRELKDFDTATSDLVTRIANLANKHSLDAAQFFCMIDQMLAYTPSKDKTNGEQWDFARFARTMLARLERALPIAIERLTCLRDVLCSRKERESVISPELEPETATRTDQYIITAARGEQEIRAEGEPNVTDAAEQDESDDREGSV